MYNYEYDVNYKNYDEYAQQFLTVFNINKYDESKIKIVREVLFNIIKTEPLFDELFEKCLRFYSFPLTQMISHPDKECSMILLFSYDYFNKFHNCIKVYFANKDKDNKDELIKELQILYDVIN